MEEMKLKEIVKKELNKFEFIRISMGYRYLIDAILICIKDQNALDNLNKNVFPKVAEKHNALSFMHIKWCIEQSIRTMYNNTNSKIISSYFNLKENIKPSLKFFIYTIVSKIEWKNN